SSSIIPAMSDLTGRTLGKYQLQERLGRGGMAEVYKAHHPGLDRHVAVKVLHPHLAEAPDFLGRFKREAQAVARLRHPHIVQVYDFDVEGEQHYMVMEYVQGVSLKAHLDDLFVRGGRMPVDEVLGLFRALLDAAGYAHAQGMIHRDLKPANVMLDPNGRPILTDFGIAKILGGSTFTASGVTVGTPTYMSPEQCSGEPGDTRSDLYSLGVMLYECLTGQVPYQGETTVAVLLKHLNEPIPPLRETRPELPVSLERAVTKALAKNPDERFQTAGEMWEALAELIPASQAMTSIGIAVPKPAGDSTPLADAASPAVTAPVSSRASERATLPTLRRAPRPVLLGTAALAVVVIALAALFATLSLLGSSQTEKALTDGEAQLAAGNYQLAADAFTTALQTDPQNVRALLGRAQAYEQLQQVTEALADVEQVVALAPNDPTGYLERARLNAQYGLFADPAAVLSDLDRAVQLAPDSAHAHFLRGWAILNFPLVDGAPNPLAALDDLQKSVSLDSKNAEAQFTLARALLAASQPADALTPANRAIELDPQSTTDRELRAHIQFALGDFHAASDDLTAALGLEADATAQATLYAERGYLRRRLNAPADAQSDLQDALNRDPNSRIAKYLQLLLTPSLPRPDAAELEAARALAPDDPIWQAIISDLLAGP
ncbi:MAG: Serine/threonine-protein kinase, partial [Anaerolineales bacterium]|nr:Serine/threonine-protein kinase [Anaerolineales bacterium]